MNLKCAFAALMGSIMLEKAWSFDQTNINESSMAVVNAEGETRILQNPGFNCIVTAQISCTALKDNAYLNCDELFIRKDRCGPLDVMMQYKYCNKEPQKIIFRKPLTEASLYDDFDLKLDERDLPGNECRTMSLQRTIDTCRRNWISASIKIEGWKDYFENTGNYCFVYKHYFPKINKYPAPTDKPTSEEIPMLPPAIELNTLCFLETFVGKKCRH
jgi:hypothetical protein